MKRIKFILFLLIFTLLFIKCQNKKQANFIQINNEINQENPVNYKINEEGNIPLLDTVIKIDNIISSIKSKNVITEKSAQETLYKYYQKKGYCIEGKIPAGKSIEDSDLMCIQFDTAYFVNLNCDNNLDAIVEYWITPYAGSSRCYLPHKAIVLNLNGKLSLTNQDFIKNNYTVNKVEQVNDCSAVLHGVEWNCSEDKIIRNFKVFLK